MIDWSLASGFALASFGISVTPGPSWLYVLSVSLSSGRQAGFCAVAGNATGISGHVLAALLGLSALITHEPRAYLVLKWCGAVYLCWLGIKMIPLKLFRTNSASTIANDTVTPHSQRTRRSKLTAYRDGVFVNLLNPKVPVLMLALMPQFISRTIGAPEPQIVAYGLIHMTIASCVLSTLVLTSGTAESVFHPNSQLRTGLRWVGGIIMIVFGCRMLFV